MLKKQKKILKTICLLFFLAITSTFITDYLCPSLTSTWVDKKFKQEEISTIDPWLKKRWEHVKILSKAADSFKQTADCFKQTANSFKVSKTILLWTKFFGASDYVPKLSNMCPLPKCSITSNRQYLNQSDAVIFHLRDMSLNDMPQWRIPKQVWILLHHESPHHTPDILNHLNGVFNWTATYRLDSEIILIPLIRRHFRKVKKNYAKGKTKMIAWFVSNCRTPSNRERFVSELQKSIPVDIYGYCGKINCMPRMSDRCYTRIASTYRFYLSFENSICKDYVTEKLFNVLNFDIVPIVLGGANYSFVAPPSSYIDALTFKSPRDLAKYLFRVAKDEKLYNSYFEWRKSYEITGEHYACKICQKLHEPMVEPVFYTNISNWWFGDAECKTWPL